MKVIKLNIVIDATATEIIRRDHNDIVEGSSTFTPSGVDLYEAVMDYLKTNHQFLIGRLSAEQAIFSIGSASSSEQDARIELVGRNLDTGMPQSREISTSMIREPVNRVLDMIISKVTRRIFRMVSDDSSDITFDNEIILSGEYSKLSGIDRRLEDAIRAEALPEARLVTK